MSLTVDRPSSDLLELDFTLFATDDVAERSIRQAEAEQREAAEQRVHAKREENERAQRLSKSLREARLPRGFD